ncbi:hypothetical protein, partial [Neorhizobium galegae]|uniref:hypothetical protein n=1 Tax=Neorhizobium galegae TaxID=399 RepID=UPI002035576F
VEPLPLVGRGWGGDFIQHQNPSRLPATLPTRGRVKDAALPHIPYAIALPARKKITSYMAFPLTRICRVKRLFV